MFAKLLNNADQTSLVVVFFQQDDVNLKINIKNYSHHGEI
jgi:hypothetical protein